MTKRNQVIGRQTRRTFIVHCHGDAGARFVGPNPGKWNFSGRQKASDFGIFRMWRSQDNAIGLQRRYGGTQFPLDMVVMRVDQLEYHPIAMLSAFQHAAKQHLPHPVAALPGLPIGNGAVAVVDGKDQVRPRSTHPLSRDRRNIAQPVN
jgi:hypothetical protein